jgi:putative hydrolase of the HAD superfamily
MELRAVIFDLFGTLTEDFAAAFGRHSTDFVAALDVPHEPFMHMWRQTLEERTIGKFQSVEASIEHVCEAIGVHVSAQMMAEAVAIRVEQIKSMLQPKSDAIGTIRQLKTRGYKIGLLSNCSIEIPILWPEIEFAPLFDSAVFSSRERLKKPDPRIYSLVCDRLGVTPGNCLYVADGENYELAAAAQAGLHPILIRNPAAQKRPELFKEATEWQGRAVSELSEVLKIVDAGIEQEQYS